VLLDIGTVLAGIGLAVVGFVVVIVVCAVILALLAAILPSYEGRTRAEQREKVAAEAAEPGDAPAEDASVDPFDPDAGAEITTPAEEPSSASDTDPGPAA
jgi:hypothetical protein